VLAAEGAVRELLTQSGISACPLSSFLSDATISRPYTGQFTGFGCGKVISTQSWRACWIAVATAGAMSPVSTINPAPERTIQTFSCIHKWKAHASSNARCVISFATIDCNNLHNEKFGICLLF
jgi:hypothetical protein